MNIRVIKDKTQPTHFTGGEFGISRLDIYIDPSLPERTQQELIIHCVIENYCRSWQHGKVEELCGYVEDALDKLKE